MKKPSHDLKDSSKTFRVFSPQKVTDFVHIGYIVKISARTYQLYLLIKRVKQTSRNFFGGIVSYSYLC